MTELITQAIVNDDPPGSVRFPPFVDFIVGFFYFDGFSRGKGNVRGVLVRMIFFQKSIPGAFTFFRIGTEKQFKLIIKGLERFWRQRAFFGLAFWLRGFCL